MLSRESLQAEKVWAEEMAEVQMTVEDVYTMISPLAMQVLKIDHFDSTVTMNSTEEWDSLTHVRLLSAIERQFPIEIGDEDAYRLTTADRLVRYVHSAMEGKQ